MHESVYQWTRTIVNKYVLWEGSTLEVGSLDVNGSVRDCFRGWYFGIDQQHGKGVDLVYDVEDDPPIDVLGYYDNVVSTEMLEHCVRPWRAIHNMTLYMKEHGSHLLITTRGFETGHFVLHDYPGDFWRFSRFGLAQIVKDEGLYIEELQNDPDYPGVFLHARRF